METMGASHSSDAARQSSSGIISLRLVEYSRMRPQPVQVKLHVCSGSSCNTKANLGVRNSLCLTIWAAIFAVNASGNRIILVCFGQILVQCNLHRLNDLGWDRLGLAETRHQQHQRREGGRSRKAAASGAD